MGHSDYLTVILNGLSSKPVSRWLVLPILLLSLACERHGGSYPTDPNSRSLVVHGMIGPGEQRQAIIVEYSRGIVDGYFKGLTPATGAEVEVVGDQVYHFFEDPGNPGVYRAEFTPRPGQRYKLQVRVPTGEVLTAETLVPDTPRPVSPSVDTTISWGDYVTLRWSSAAGAASYVLGSYDPGSPSSINALLHPSLWKDTTATVQPWIGGTMFHYRVAAVDSNYLRYLKSTPVEDEEHHPTYSSVNGGYGLFGSYALSSTWSISVR